jgi:hypothetical protein
MLLCLSLFSLMGGMPATEVDRKREEKTKK